MDPKDGYKTDTAFVFYINHHIHPIGTKCAGKIPLRERIYSVRKNFSSSVYFLKTLCALPTFVKIAIMQDGTNGNSVIPVLAKHKKIAPQRRPLSETQPKVLPYGPASLHRSEKATTSPLMMAKIKKANGPSSELSPVVGSTAALRPIPKSGPESKFGRNQQLRLNPIQHHNSASNVDFGDRPPPKPIQHVAFHDRTGGPSRKGYDQKLKDSTAALHPRPIQKVTCRSLDRRQAYKPSMRTGRPPPPTDPVHTAALWKRVKLRNGPSEKKMPPELARPTLFSALKLRMPSTSSAADDASTSQGTANAKDRAFRDTVLRGRGINFTDALTLETPYAHFRTDVPSGVKTVMSWYQDRCGLSECEVWHEKDHDLAVQQASQYRIMVRLKENEVKFSHRGKQYFFKDDSLIPPEEAIRGSSTYYKLEWDPHPDGQLLQAPPMQADNVTEEVFDFYTKPDCTYWLSHRRFNAVYRNHISRLTHVLEPAGAISPYLTIEFEKDGDPTGQAAENQVAAASALILYNRILLRCKGLAEQGQGKHSWNPTILVTSNITASPSPVHRLLFGLFFQLLKPGVRKTLGEVAPLGACLPGTLGNPTRCYV